MVRNIIEVKKPINRGVTEIVTSEEYKLNNINVKAPKIVGIASINENFDASFRLNPKIRAAVIAVPDREAPGIRAKVWISPINKAPSIVRFARDLFCFANLKDKNNKIAKEIFA